ncbi:penicillin acylase family protein [Streptomyces sp. NPDC001581]|uniref:penicillin acylase family protein n=1 Tax=Streptomyces sp. NPDC001581 TaxID=3154386 RepID=UPI0033200951
MSRHAAHEDCEEYTVAGLTAPVEILIDTHGVPHLYATCEDDLFLAQGFDAARDRLFQLDLWRRRGLGLLAEAFGESFTARDRAARLFLYRGELDAEWRAYGPGTARVAAAFTAGVNAYVDLCERRPDLLPPEFHAVGHRPGRWRPEDVALIRSHGLFGNVEQEVARALTLRDFGPEVEDLRRVREPARALRVPGGLDPADIPDDVLAVYRLATAPVDFAAPGTPSPRIRPEGSNNWVVAPRRTATGRPLLANDPHRSISLPSLRRLVHLSAPGLDAIGAGEPALPGLSVGHNGHLAFGLTIFAIDQEDLYVYETHPGDPDRYLHNDGWEPMRVIRERVPVAGADPVDVELRFTRHGPVVHRDHHRHRAFAVRAAWLEPGMAPYLGGLNLLRARTTGDFLDALDRWGAPGENMVWATADGTIGLRPVGRVPVRPNWDGLLPVPGDGRYEWDGTHPADALPTVIDPPEERLASANEMNLPDDFPHDRCTVGFDWDHRYRYERIAEVLGDTEGVTVEDCLRLQADTVNSAARRILATVADRLGDRGDGGGRTSRDTHPDLRSAVALLHAWDADERTDSAAAALYQIWQRRHLRPALLRHALAPLVPPARLPDALARLLVDEELGVDVRTDLALLDTLAEDALADADADAGSVGPAVLDRVLIDSLTAAWAETRALLGDDPARWRWGGLHHAAPAHPLSTLLGDRLSLPRLPRRERGGSGDTVLNTSYDSEFRQQEGASFRIVVDVGAWDRSRVVNAPGQSGRPDSPHWDDLYDTWAQDGSFPLHYSRASVEAHTRTRVVLAPPGDRAGRASKVHR